MLKKDIIKQYQLKILICRQRNLRQGAIKHYRQSYVQFFKSFEPDTSIEELDEDAYKRYVLHLRSKLFVLICFFIYKSSICVLYDWQVAIILTQMEDFVLFIG